MSDDVKIIKPVRPGTEVTIKDPAPVKKTVKKTVKKKKKVVFEENPILKLNPNQRKFVEEYLETGNATRSYYAAYPKCKSDNVAAVNANHLLRKPNVKAVVEYVYEQQWKQKEKQIGKVFNGILKRAEASIEDVMEMDEDGELKFKKFSKGKPALIKSLSQTKKISKDGKVSYSNQVTIHDPAKAADQLIEILNMVNKTMTINHDIVILPPKRPEIVSEEKE